MLELYTTKRMKDKLSSATFDLEAHYKRISNDKFLSSKRRIEKMAGLFYLYFDAIPESGSKKTSQKHVDFRLKEIAPYLENCDSVELQSADMLGEYCKALCDVAYSAIRNRHEVVDFDFLKKNVLFKYKEVAEEKSTAR